jgi:hypothetical protein
MRALTTRVEWLKARVAADTSRGASFPSETSPPQELANARDRLASRISAWFKNAHYMNNTASCSADARSVRPFSRRV